MDQKRKTFYFKKYTCFVSRSLMQKSVVLQSDCELNSTAKLLNFTYDAIATKATASPKRYLRYPYSFDISFISMLQIKQVVVSHKLLLKTKILLTNRKMSKISLPTPSQLLYMDFVWAVTV